jgi:hypothetical protein
VIEEVQFIYDSGLTDLIILALPEFALAGEMFGVTAEGGGAEAKFCGQSSIGHSIQETDFNGGTRRMVADGTALYHKCTPKSEISGWRRMDFRLTGEGRGGQNG